MRCSPITPLPRALTVAGDRTPLVAGVPGVGPAKSISVSLLAGFNDIFFMALMFFLSGLFVWHSLTRKGEARFLGDRGRRLGLPFLGAAALLAPVAYYPSYLTTTSTPSLAGFIDAWCHLVCGRRARRGSSGCCWRLMSWRLRCSGWRRRWAPI